MLNSVTRGSKIDEIGYGDCSFEPGDVFCIAGHSFYKQTIFFCVTMPSNSSPRAGRSDAIQSCMRQVCKHENSTEPVVLRMRGWRLTQQDGGCR